MPDAAFALAALRAARVRRLAGAERSAVTAALEQTGRRLVELGDGAAAGVTVGWDEGYEPTPQDGALSVRRLSAMPLLTLAACIGLGWRDHGEAPYPGEPVTQDAVLEVMRGLGADRSHALAALKHELPAAGLITLARGTVTLGPALAAWPPAQIDALRRFADTLPGAADA